MVTGATYCIYILKATNLQFGLFFIFFIERRSRKYVAFRGFAMQPCITATANNRFDVNLTLPHPWRVNVQSTATWGGNMQNK